MLLLAQAQSQLQLQILIPVGGWGDRLQRRKKMVNWAQRSHSWAGGREVETEGPTLSGCGHPDPKASRFVWPSPCLDLQRSFQNQGDGSLASGSPEHPQALLCETSCPSLPGSTEVMAERMITGGLSLPPKRTADGSGGGSSNISGSPRNASVSTLTACLPWGRPGPVRHMCTLNPLSIHCPFQPQPEGTAGGEAVPARTVPGTRTGPVLSQSRGA